MLFLLHAHLVKHLVVRRDAEFVEVLLDDEVLADIAALEPPAK